MENIEISGFCALLASINNNTFIVHCITKKNTKYYIRYYDVI